MVCTAAVYRNTAWEKITERKEDVLTEIPLL